MTAGEITGKYTDDFIRVEIARYGSALSLATATEDRMQYASWLLDWVEEPVDQGQRFRRFEALSRAFVNWSRDGHKPVPSEEIIAEAEKVLAFLNGGI